MEINFKRLQKDIDELSHIGRSSEDMGIYRMAFSKADMEARAWLKQRIEDANLEFAQDGAANIFGKVNTQANRPSVLMGSHIDSVPAAGHLDGALGVLTALECLRRVREENIQTNFGLEMVAFSDEEGRFGGLLGSEALVGGITPERIHNAQDLSGLTLRDAMGKYGMDAGGG